jgi:hypothetical protein
MIRRRPGRRPAYGRPRKGKTQPAHYRAETAEGSPGFHLDDVASCGRRLDVSQQVRTPMQDWRHGDSTGSAHETE